MPPGTSRARSDYGELLERVRAAGLLQPQPGYYARVTVVAAAITAAGLATVMLTTGWVPHLIGAVVLGFATGRAGLLVHDLGHRQVLRSRRASTMCGLLLGNLGMGFSWSWWVADHNCHHRYAGLLGRDPSTLRTFTAFTPAAALASRGLVRAMMRHQAVLEFPLYCFIALLFVIESVGVLRRGRPRHAGAEAVLMAAHYVLLPALLLIRLPLAHALVVIVAQKALFGLYAGSVVAPNHKGMPLWESDPGLDYVRRQVIPSRNVVGSRLVDLWYGGLNSQIEHHLFPSMARNQLPAARPIVRAFCHEHGIPYHQTGVIQSYREIFGFLARTSAPLREAGSR